MKKFKYYFDPRKLSDELEKIIRTAVESIGISYINNGRGSNSLGKFISSLVDDVREKSNTREELDTNISKLKEQVRDFSNRLQRNLIEKGISKLKPKYLGNCLDELWHHLCNELEGRGFDMLCGE
jgi:FtsZ-binding cell division protein ZapB